MKVLFVPSLGLDVSLLDRLAASVDYPVKYKVALNNGAPGALQAFEESHPDWIVKEPSCGNLGCAGSWNEVAKIFPDEKSWLIMNDDAWFLPGYLEKICDCADENLDAPLIYLNDSDAYYCFVWTAAGREKYGTFDENFFPSYYEDADYRVRHFLMEVRDYPYALQGLPPLPHGKPRTGGVDYSAMIQGAGLFLRQYFIRKWGIISLEGSQYCYATPYKDHRLTPKDWVWYPEMRAKIHPLWETFMSMPNPSIYE